MSIQRFTKKPITIEAMQWNGLEDDNALSEFMGGWTWCHNSEGQPCIQTLESSRGFHVVSAGDWIIKGIKGEFYPCKPDIFAATYGAEQDAIKTEAAIAAKDAEIERLKSANNMLLEALKAAEQDFIDINEYWNGADGSSVDAAMHNVKISTDALLAVRAAIGEAKNVREREGGEPEMSEHGKYAGACWNELMENETKESLARMVVGLMRERDAHKAQVQRLSAPVSDEEMACLRRLSVDSMPVRFKRLIAARAAKETA